MPMTTMRTIRFHSYGEPTEVLRLETADIPAPGPGCVRVRVHACGLNPADWALCRGLFASELPRGIGLDVSGTVDAIGEGVDGVSIGDLVLGAADYADSPSAGAADYAVLKHWTAIPPGLEMLHAAALPMAIETACRSVDSLDVNAGQKILINGGGTMMGFAAVQMCIMRGARVYTTAGETFAQQLRDLGAEVTGYGDGMVERVLAMAGGPVDAVLDTAGARGTLPDLIKIAGGEPKRVLTIANVDAAEYGVRTSFEEGVKLRYDAFPEYAKLAAEGKFFVPIARTYTLENWREAMNESLSGKAHGKLLLIP